MTPAPMTPDGIEALTARVASDLDRIAHPRQPWLEPRTGPDGRPALDVLVVGGGQSGLAIAFGPMRAQVRNILVIDKAAHGQEGPWLTYARMQTLRTRVPAFTAAFADLDPGQRYKLLCATIVPSPGRELLVGEVLRLHAREGLVDPARLRVTDAYKPVGRLFGDAYARQGDRFELKRETFAEWQARSEAQP